MPVLTREQIRDLAAETDGLLVSLYLPTHRAGRETEQDPIRLKNLLTDAERDLVAQGVRATAARDLLAPARALLDDLEFWSHQGDGLAVFLSPAGMREYRLPVTVPEVAVVADRYHVKPLLGLLAGNGRFHVLALSLNRVRLFEAGRDTMREIDLRDVPESLRESVGYDWEQKSLQFHTGTAAGAGGRRRAVYHGHGSPKDDDKAEIAAFFRQVDAGVTALVGADRVPLVLAGAKYLTAIYRSVSAHPCVVEHAVEGSPDRSSPEELCARAWPAVEPRFAEDRRVAGERFEALKDKGGASGDLDLVLSAAFGGRVESLFAARGVQRWGRFDEASLRAESHSRRQPGDQDLVDLAVVQSLASGGDVFLVEPAAVPGGGVVAAVFRF